VLDSTGLLLAVLLSGSESGRQFSPHSTTTSIVEPPCATHAQAVDSEPVLRVPNRQGSPLFFENKEQEGIEWLGKRAVFRR